MKETTLAIRYLFVELVYFNHIPKLKKVVLSSANNSIYKFVPFGNFGTPHIKFEEYITHVVMLATVIHRWHG